jgi:DNA invertase Pin-like site-specific DNA recombinase
MQVPTNRKSTALGYVRVSSQEQVANGYGLAVQERAVRQYCKFAGLRLLAVYRDEGISGSNGLDSRTGLSEALVRLERGEATTLVVPKYDRLARDLLLQLTITDRLAKAGVAVVSVDEPDVDGPDHLRELIRNVLASIAQYERCVIRGRMMAGKAAKRARGGYTGGTPAFGTRSDRNKKALVHDDQEQAALDMIVRLHRGGHSYRQICAALTAAGHKPRSGVEWLPMTVRRIALRTAS